MKIELDNGYCVEYKDSLRVKHGDDVNVFFEKDFVPRGMREGLERINREIGNMTELVVSSVGRKACVHE